MGLLPPKKGKGELPSFCGKLKRVIPIYAHRESLLIIYVRSGKPLLNISWHNKYKLEFTWKMMDFYKDNF